MYTLAYTHEQQTKYLASREPIFLRAYDCRGWGVKRSRNQRLVMGNPGDGVRKIKNEHLENRSGANPRR